MSAKAIDRWIWTAIVIVAIYWTADLLWRVHVSNKLLNEVWPPETREGAR